MTTRYKKLTVMFFFAFWSTFSLAGNFGSFVGDVVAKWVGPEGDYRYMELTEPFAYIDPSGARWDAPVGSVVNGSSIPRFAWSLIDSPYVGTHRKASVIHDVACDEKMRPWRDVHRAFYTAMLADNTNPIKAKIMYGAVYYFGPRWKEKIHLTSVPIHLVDSTIKNLQLKMAPGEYMQTEITQSLSHQLKSSAGSISPMNSRPASSNGVDSSSSFDQADITITIVPTSIKDDANIPEELSKLKLFIETNDPSLEAIEQYLN